MVLMNLNTLQKTLLQNVDHRLSSSLHLRVVGPEETNQWEGSILTDVGTGTQGLLQLYSQT